MDQPSAWLADMIEEVVRIANYLLTPWAGFQALIIIACFLVALVLSYFATPALEAQLRRFRGRPALLRALLTPLRRLRWILWAALLWAAALTLLSTTWPSRSFLVLLAAQLVTAWCAITIGSRMIRNRNLASIVSLVGWPLAALTILGVDDDVARLLDAAALPVGEGRISLLMVIEAVALLLVLLWLSSAAGGFVERRLRQTSDMTPTYQVLLAKLARATFLVAAIVLSLTAVGVDLTALAVFSGALGLGLGFGLQKIISNLISGVIILMDRSIKPGDVISLGGTFGWVSELESRYVALVTRDGVEHLIPNETFVSETVINWSHSDRKIRLEIAFRTRYQDEPNRTRTIASEAVVNVPRVLPNPAPICHVFGFGDYGIDFVLRFWITDPENGVVNISGLAYLAIWEAFKEHGIGIPYPQQEIRIQGGLPSVG